MTPNEINKTIDALYRAMGREDLPRRYTREEMASCLGSVIRKRDTTDKGLSIDVLLSEKFIDEVLTEAYALPRKVMPDYPNNAQAAWRWTMNLIDQIDKHPELLAIDDLKGEKDWDSIAKAMVVKDFMKIIRSSKFIFWKTEIFNASLNGAESFVGESFDITDFMVPTYYTYDKVQISNNNDKECNFGMLLLPMNHKNCLSLLPIGLNGVISEVMADGAAVIDSFTLEMTGSAIHGEELSKDHLVGQQLMAANEFLKMKVAAKERARLPRPERRRMKKEGKKEPELYTISLRRSQGDASPAGDGEHIERDCHWLVSGHWRRQWYPSVEKHAPLWIDGYVKGDTTKPFKASKQRVFAAVR